MSSFAADASLTLRTRAPARRPSLQQPGRVQVARPRHPAVRSSHARAWRPFTQGRARRGFSAIRQLASALPAITSSRNGRPPASRPTDPIMPMPTRSLAPVLALLLATSSGVAGAATARQVRAAEVAPQAQIDPDKYVVREAPVEELALPAPKLPDLSVFSAERVREKIGSTTPGQVRYRRLVEVLELSEFTGGDGRVVEWASRQSSSPRVIVIENGYLRPRDLVKQLPPEHLEEVSPGVFLLRMPLIVGHGATLHIDEDVRDFRMSEERGAFLVNDGRLFITGSRLTGWREQENAAATFRKGSAFRPFLLSWGGTETYISGSKVHSLGYDASKSYGVSISQYSPGMVAKMRRGSPKAWLIDSEFADNWFGFYCYEADDLVIARNVYRGNIVYGIDPHDRSHRLVIAENQIEGTVQKHGLIISREVNDSFIFRNRITSSGLSGIVLDRASNNNVVAENVVFGNSTDGITIYESSDNLLWENRAVGNGRHGIRVRNSQRVRLYGNRAVANGLSGVYGHIKDLTGTDRNLRLDPFEQQVSLVVVGGQLTHNRSGPVTIDSPLSLELYDVELLAPTHAHGLKLTGVLGQYQHQVLDLLVRQKVPVVIEPASGAGREGS
jgi:mannuronan 5-epimerase